MKLTEKQEIVFKELIEYNENNNRFPTMLELTEVLNNKGLNIKYQQSVTQYFHSLEKAGYIARKINVARGITILKNIEGKPIEFETAIKECKLNREDREELIKYYHYLQSRKTN